MSKCLKHFKHLLVRGKEATRLPLRLLRVVAMTKDIVELIENN
jgi:hypothetical protein